MLDLGRRHFLTLLGGAATAWPMAAQAQQPPMPVIGFLDVINSPGRLAAFHQGLGESGYVLGQNVGIEIRSAEGHYNRFPEFAADLVRRRDRRARYHAGCARRQSGNDHDSPSSS